MLKIIKNCKFVTFNSLKTEHVIASSVVAKARYGASFKNVGIRFTLNAICPAAKAYSLGITANSAVHNFAPNLDVQQTHCDEDESCDEDSDSNDSGSEFSLDDEHDEIKSTRAVLHLIKKVNA